MRNIKTLLIIMIIATGFSSYSQDPTIGLQFFDGNASEGYTLFTPAESNHVYLIDNCGEKINEWEFSEKPGATCYLLENGTLLRAGKDSLEIRDWDNSLIWSYAMNDNGLLQHHDIEPLPNGNILCVITDRYTKAEMTEQGRDPENIGANIRLDKIVELEPVGLNGANIVWEWKFIDHLIQDFDNSKLNFGLVEDHPELMDINYGPGNTLDWSHTNGIDYNSSLDHILLSPRNLSEILIIDHSTTTAEAATHIGGNSGKGGDILWRWGNPQAYRQLGDRKLFGQHDPKWVEAGFPDVGKISVFNNGRDENNSALTSSVCLLDPQIVGGAYQLEENEFLPLDFFWSWSGDILGHTLDQEIRSGCHELENGNILLCEHSLGQFSEITKSGELVWSYINPVDQVVNNQFDITTDNDLFRAEKYSVNYPGFVGKDLSPQGTIENTNSISEACISVSIAEKFPKEKFGLENPIKNNTIHFNRIIEAKKIVIMNMKGETVYVESNFSGQDLAVNLIPSVYFLQLYTESGYYTHKIIVY